MPKVATPPLAPGEQDDRERVDKLVAVKSPAVSKALRIAEFPLSVFHTRLRSGAVLLEPKKRRLGFFLAIL